MKHISTTAKPTSLARNALLLCLFALLPLNSVAQPKLRRNQQATETQQQQQQQKSQGMTQRMRLQYPTALDMPEDVVWRRDIYREIDLNQGANAGLYYPTEPVGRQMNLFTYVFRLALNGYIPVYEYRLDGNEVLDESAKVEMKTVLDNYHIFYEEEGGKIKVDNSDIPSAEVKAYYLKESAYYDQANSSFHIKVLAFCPVMLREDDFGGEASKYPLFWVKYSDVEPFLSRQTVMTSDKNNAATMTMDDYFTLNKYKGKIYKTTNMLGLTLAQYCKTDSALTREQQRIEAELEAFRNGIFGAQEQEEASDSTATSTAKTDKAAAKTATKASATRSRQKTDTPKAKKEKTTTKKTKSSSSSSSGSAARVSMRRERH